MKYEKPAIEGRREIVAQLMKVVSGNASSVSINFSGSSSD